MALYNRRGAHKSWSQTKDWPKRTQPARDKRLDQFLRQVDPNGEMDPKTRMKAAKAARRAHCLKMAEKSVQVRKARKEARQQSGDRDGP
jgi:hypothetical protein